MYTLTDYSAEDLFILSGAIQSQIEDTKGYIEHANKIESEEMRAILLKEKTAKLTVLREHHVHLLTAFQIVKDRNQVLSN